MRPLGSYEQFRAISGTTFPWGPDGKWREWFGGEVIEGLVRIMDEHIDAVAHGSQYGQPGPAAIGCVPWITSGPVLDRLARLTGCCIVVDKGASTTVVSRLADADCAMPNVLSGLRDLAPADDEGSAPVLGPYDRLSDHALGPLRVAGWRARKGKAGPLVHAKLLLLGELRWAEDYFGGESLFFFPRSLWWGSANWTKGSASHLEAGFWADDKALVDRAQRFLEAVIAFSEPWGSAAVGPEPNLVEIQYDDEAMLEALADSDEWTDLS